MRGCGPIWTYWQFVMERLNGTLPKLVRSRSNPYLSLVKSISRKYQAELITAFGETFLPEEWAEANGKIHPLTSAVETPFPSGDNSRFVLLPSRSKPALPSGLELDAMKAVLAEERVDPVLDAICGLKYLRVRLENGVVAGSRSCPSDDGGARRRYNFVRVRSSDRAEGADGAEKAVSVTVYGPVLHYVAVFAFGSPMAFDYIECIRSGGDRLGKYGLPETRFGLPCFSSFGGLRRFVTVGAIDAVVGTLFTRGKHHILHPREPFSGLS